VSTALPPRPRTSRRTLRVCIVASTYNEEFTDALVNNAVEELAEILPNARIDLVRVPGAFEIPVTIEAMLRHEQPNCVIALGLIIRGSTDHADLIARSVTDSLQQLAIAHATPVIHEVLLVADNQQAHARCVGDALNRGREAARAAAAMVKVMAEIDRSSGPLRPPSRHA
jgi:6,7-dimethyl-8-ribityllumazine synthase